MAAPLISIVVPTYNEAKNVAPIYASLMGVLQDTSWELIVVDDNSPDGTAEAVRQLARQYPNVRCIQRVQERGLCSAVLWGVQATHGDVIVVMDGDLQHDPALIPAMLEQLRNGHDIVSASRFLSGSSATGLSSMLRNRISQLGNKLVDMFLGVRLTDPLTGFFATSRSLFLRSVPRMQADGFKVFFDLVYHNRKASISELAFDFRARQSGESKLQIYVLWLFLCDIASKLTFSLVPTRLVSFVSVGTIGLLVHFSVLYASLALGAVFWMSQAIATVLAMVFNFSLNNVLTYSSQRLKGMAFLEGLFLYALVASVGIVANVSTAQMTYVHFRHYTFLAACTGLVIDVIWRYALSNRLIWGSGSILRRKK